jgi:hypothetical protein
VQSGFVYVPLPLDPEIAREARHRSARASLPSEREALSSMILIEHNGRPYIKSLNIGSLAANYRNVDRGLWQRLHGEFLRTYPQVAGAEILSPNGKLRTIVLGIMPYFIRKGRGFERGGLQEEQLLDLISSKIEIPGETLKQADQYLDTEPVRQRLNEMKGLHRSPPPLPDGPITSQAFRLWLHRTLQVQMVNTESERLERELAARERLDPSKRNHVATLLYLAEKGSFELDGFGFSRIGSRDDFLIYKHTGEYVLKDYYARSYRFPDCRVAVSTAGPLRPLVVETYKHPFLLGHAPRQEICISGYHWPEQFNAENIIKLLEEGINALLYGYDARRRNGYHSLDPTLYYVKGIEFGDYRV